MNIFGITKTKRYITLQNLFPAKSKINLDQALRILIQLCNVPFLMSNSNISFNARVSLNIDVKKKDQQIQGFTKILYHSCDIIKVAVITNNISKILKKNADVIGLNSVLNGISNNLIKVNLLLTEPEHLPLMFKYNKMLIAKGLFPSTKLGTVSNKLETALYKFKNGKILYKTNNSGTIDIKFGNSKLSMFQLKNNLINFFLSVLKQRPKNLRGRFIKNLSIWTTISPSFNIKLSSIKKNN